jgi:hypothetical protein
MKNDEIADEFKKIEEEVIPELFKKLNGVMSTTINLKKIGAPNKTVVKMQKQ